MSLPTFEPMLAVRWDRPFDDENWWFEVKWDGFRVVAGRDRSGVTARSRRGLDLTATFPELLSTPLPNDVVVDGEVVAFDPEGKPSFSLLQRRTGFGGRGTSAAVGVSLVVFDLLHDGVPLIDHPYEVRRRRLEGLDLPPPVVVPDATPATGLALFDAVVSQGMEGIVGKRMGSVYRPGRRSSDWRKISIRHRLRAVVGGYVAGTGGRSGTFGSVLIGIHADEGLRWVGAVGSGFDDATLMAFKDAFGELERPTSPFANEVPLALSPIWLEPGIVISVEYKEWTADDHLRAPVYKGIELTDPESVTWEEEGPG